MRFLRHQLERERPLSVAGSSVQYRDISPATSIAAMPEIDPFTKPTAYAWQREYRLVVHPYSASDYLDLELPDLRELLPVVY